MFETPPVPPEEEPVTARDVAGASSDEEEVVDAEVVDAEDKS